jgi:hypothetical protein
MIISSCLKEFPMTIILSTTISKGSSEQNKTKIFTASPAAISLLKFYANLILNCFFTGGMIRTFCNYEDSFLIKKGISYNYWGSTDWNWRV